MARTLDVVPVSVSVAYPFLVYFGLRILPPGFFAIGVFALAALGLVFGRKQTSRNTLPYLIAGVVVLILAARSPMVGLKAYPVMLNLALAGAFAYSLRWPPTIIEQIVRLRRPDMPQYVISYLRKVTICWLAFFLVNAGLSAATAMSGSLKLWTLYNGFISYVAIGVMFGAEYLVRQVVHQRSRHAA
jgi:uncharacterized membrane protein